jgi:hypothetical protein
LSSCAVNLSPEELEMIRQQIEEGFDNIAEVDDEIRGIVARKWPHLLSKLPPQKANETRDRFGKISIEPVGRLGACAKLRAIFQRLLSRLMLQPVSEPGQAHPCLQIQ